MCFFFGKRVVHVSLTRSPAQFECLHLTMESDSDLDPLPYFD